MSQPPAPAKPIRAMLIEDDQQVAQTVREGLHSYGFAVTHAASLAEGRHLLTTRSCDVVILDLMLPDGNGLELAAAIRQAGEPVPILMLTARDAVHERIEGFRHGADDYLCKPFDVTELAARLHAILRRSDPSQRHVLRYGNIELDRISRTIRRPGAAVQTLSIREAELLSYLMRYPEEVLKRERILEQVWGDEAEQDSNVVNVYINYLRNKLEADGSPRVIHTLRGVGYMLSDEDPDEVLSRRG